MSKEIYYTPSIEEFRVGFEFEVYERISIDHRKGGEWTKNICTFGMINQPLNASHLERDEVRVKHLDQEDIESFGFKEDKSNSTKERYNGEMYGKSFGTYGIVLYDTVKVVIYRYDGSREYVLFTGTIRNKSELEVILKQIGVV